MQKTYVIRAALAFALAPLALEAQAVGTLVGGTDAPYFDTTSGQSLPCAGCTIATYSAGTSTPAHTFSDSTLVPTNPYVITLNSLGYTTSGIWLGSSCIKFVLTSATGVTLRTQDNVCSPRVLPSTTFTSNGPTPTVTITQLGAGAALQVFGAMNAADLVVDILAVTGSAQMTTTQIDSNGTVGLTISTTGGSQALHVTNGQARFDNGIDAGLLPGITGATCSHWTSGLCTAP
jgi:hypothetical protein